MTRCTMFGLLVCRMSAMALAANLADAVTEVAVSKGNGNPVNWLALSADGSRLAVE